MKIIVLAYALLAAAAPTTAPAPNSFPMSIANDNFQTYLHCITAAATKYAHSAATATEAADAAHGKCFREFDYYRHALRVAIAMVAQDSGENPQAATKRAEELIAQQRETGQAIALAAVLDERAKHPGK